MVAQEVLTSTSGRSEGVPLAPWQRLHQEGVGLARRRGELDVALGRWLVEARAARVHEHLGCASFEAYVEETFGLGFRAIQERVRVAQQLEELPVLSGALRSGAVSFSKVRELTRVATPDNEGEWLAETAGMRRARDVQERVAGLERGDGPEVKPPAGPAPEQQVRVTMSAEMYALFLEVGRGLAQGEPEKAWSHSEIFEAVLQGFVDAQGAVAGVGVEAEVGAGAEAEAEAEAELGAGAGAGAAASRRTAVRGPFQVSLSSCPSCARSSVVAGGRLSPVDDAVVEMAMCDGDLLGVVDGGGMQRLRAGVSPQMRRRVLARDACRCRVPGCRNHRFLTLHHLVPQGEDEGGQHTMENLLLLCTAHHKAVHTGALIIQGPTSSARFLRSDGSLYGALGFDVVRARRGREAYVELRKIGLRETEAWRGTLRAARGG